jgi:hypothetical protein
MWFGYLSRMVNVWLTDGAGACFFIAILKTQIHAQL